MKPLVFLGGTCNNSTWRDELIEYSEDMSYNINYFNPVVDDWTPEYVEIEYQMKEKSDYEVYVITPKMKGVFSIAEAVDASNKKPDKIIFCVLKDDKYLMFDEGELKSLKEVENLIKSNGAIICNSLVGIANFIHLDFYNKQCVVGKEEVIKSVNEEFKFSFDDIENIRHDILGKVMRKGRGSYNPQMVDEIIRKTIKDNL